MGVDYRAKFGIGYEIAYDINEDDIDSFLDDIVDKYQDSLKLAHLESGDGNYSGDTNCHYLCIKEPFKEGLDLSILKNKLDKIIQAEGIGTYGDFGLVGGLHVY